MGAYPSVCLELSCQMLQSWKRLQCILASKHIQGFIIPKHIKMSTDVQSENGTVNLVNLGDMRKPYNEKHSTFLESSLVSKEPIKQFKEWFDLASKTEHIKEANAMCLATATKEGKPSARFVLLKGYGEDGFRFFSNYASRKGNELEQNPFAALTFYWEPLSRSVRVEGTIEKLPAEASEEYFHSRPRSSQIGACVSPQSQQIKGREVLIETEEKLLKEFADQSITIPKPPTWGGYIVKPNMIEFWQGQSTRIHDRIRFRRPEGSHEPDGVLTHVGDNGWIYERLAP